VQLEDRSYVDIQALAQLARGSVTFEPDRIVLRIPATQPSRGSESGESTSTESISSDFQRAAIPVLGDMREWTGAISTLITTSFPVAGRWPQDYHDRVEADLMQASIAASSNADHQALQLLQNEAAAVGAWADKVVADRNTLNADTTVDPNALQNDRVLAKISQCGRFLGGMIVRGTFADDSSCH
jgi:hypothetical protein